MDFIEGIVLTFFAMVLAIIVRCAHSSVLLFTFSATEPAGKQLFPGTGLWPVGLIARFGSHQGKGIDALRTSVHRYVMLGDLRRRRALHQPGRTSRSYETGDESRCQAVGAQLPARHLDASPLGVVELHSGGGGVVRGRGRGVADG